MSDLKEDILLRFLAGNCTEEELREVNAWLEESDEHARELFGLEELCHLGKLEEAAAVSRISEAEKLLDERLKKPERAPRRKRLFFRLMRYAALIFGMAFLGGAGWYLCRPAGTQPQEELLAIATCNAVEKLKLSDGTKVWLNKNSTLKYPREFSAERRKVWLDGEAHFEVTKQGGKPFVVQCEAVEVKVLGTVFNLKSDKRNKSAVTTLIKGEVQVKGNHNEGMITLLPGQKAELNGTTSRLVVKQMDKGFENWHNDEFIFREADVNIIARTLEKSYGIKAILSPDINVDKTYSGTLKKKEDVHDVLDCIKNSVPIDYKIVGKNVFLSSKK